MRKKLKVLMTGGHAATTALAVCEEIARSHKDWEIYWIGPKEAIEGKDVASMAFKILPKVNIRVFPIVAGRLQKTWSIYTIPSLLRVPIGFLHAFFLLCKIRPDVVLSFGGYAAFPVVFCAWLLRIPTVAHSQTVAIGLANKLSLPFVEKIALARKESLPFVPPKKTVFTGNPVLESITKVLPKREMGIRPCLYMTGGSTGSQTINSALDKILGKLLKDFFVIHQTGELDFKYFCKRKRLLPDKLGKNYEVFDFIDPRKVSSLYTRADIVVSRAGANTLTEILITKRPAIVIPHPSVNFDEQVKNAQLVEATGGVVVIPQNELTGKRLYQEILKVSQKWAKMASSLKAFEGADAKAAEKIVSMLNQYQ